MGVYLVVIGAADAHHHGRYVTHEMSWRRSSTCAAAGFLAFVSSEVSVCTVCLITLDRFLRLCFPLRGELHLSRRSCVVLSLLAWGWGLSLAAVPISARLRFYGESGICLPLPITRHSLTGHGYAFGVFISLNFVLFLLIGAGQAAIYRAVQAVGSAAGSTRDTTIARRLFLVVLTDFCCWFPIGLTGLLALSGVPVPGQLDVWAAIFVLPLNSALNPFLYTLNGVLERRRAQRVRHKIKKILGKLATEIDNLPPSAVEEIAIICLRSTKIVKKDKLLSILAGRQDTRSMQTAESSTQTCS